MLTGLDITATYFLDKEQKTTHNFRFRPLTLLSYLQQALPGTTTCTGAGTKSNPYQPKTASDWFYCAKLKNGVRFPNLSSGRAWFKVAGRYVAIDPATLYASDYGTDGDTLVFDDPTYPQIAAGLKSWQEKGIDRTDIKVAELFRQVIIGETPSPMPDHLPVLATVLLVSEVARNHTDFSSNLMAVDLIQVGATLPGDLDWTWQNAIWLVHACGACGAAGRFSCVDCAGKGGFDCGDCGGSGGWQEQQNCGSCGATGVFKYCTDCGGTGQWSRYKQCRKCSGSGVYQFCRNCDRGKIRVNVTCGRCLGSGALKCVPCKGNGSTKCVTCSGKGKLQYNEFEALGVKKGIKTKIGGGADLLQNGLLPMSHTGSAFGSAFDLSGTGVYQKVKGGTISKEEAASVLTVVRRKEATVLTHWLQQVMPAVVIMDGKKKLTLKLTYKSITEDMEVEDSDFNQAYNEVLSTAMGGLTMDDQPINEDPKTEAFLTIRSFMVRYLQIRVDYLWYALDTR